MPARVDARTNGTVVDVVVTGEIDLDNAVRFEEDLANAVGNDATLVRVDMGSVGYLDSAGIRSLVLLASRLHTAQIALQLVTPPGSLAARVLQVSGLSALMYPPTSAWVGDSR